MSEPLPNLLQSSTRPVRAELSAVIRGLKPGQRIRITQTVRMNCRVSWQTHVEGAFRHFNYLRTGLATDRVPEDDILVASVHFTKPNGELSSITLDDQSQVESWDDSMTNTLPERQSLPLHRDHRRSFAENRYVYAVLSRRSKGVSIGINLNPDKLCNFDCVYCQVDRRTPGGPGDVDVAILAQELEDLLEMLASGTFFETDRFKETPPPLRRLNDIAFSGDGEPTTCPVFPEVVSLAAEARLRFGLDATKLVLITNASQLHKLRVRQAVESLTRNNGEIWAKLEAGTAEYYQLVDRTTIPFQRILDNITETARLTPVVIQALFLRMHGQPPALEEQETFCQRLVEIVGVGGRIKLVQVYTVARTPTESYVQPLTNVEVDALTALVRARTGLEAEAFYGME